VEVKSDSKSEHKDVPGPIARNHKRKVSNEKTICGDSHEDYSPEYVSPEQTGRTEVVVDFRSDLYSLGMFIGSSFF
jgi:hypothetical protein